MVLDPRRRWSVRCSVFAVAAAFLALELLSPGASAKGPDPAQSGSAYNEKRYNRDSVYASINGPDIDAFNFNFVFDLPLAIGLNYPENAGLSLQVNLAYNSNVSYWQRAAYHRRFWRIRRRNPFGLGFDVNLGRIITTLEQPLDTPKTSHATRGRHIQSSVWTSSVAHSTRVGARAELVAVLTPSVNHT